MRNLTKKDLENDKELLDSIIMSLNLEEKKQTLEELQKESLKRNFWDNTFKAKKIMRKIGSIKDEVETSNRLKDDLDSLIQLYDLTDNPDDLIEDYKDIHNKIKEFESFKFLSGKYDNHDALLSIHAGQGGTESNDWCQMLFRMYTRWVERKKYKYNFSS